MTDHPQGDVWGSGAKMKRRLLAAVLAVGMAVLPAAGAAAEEMILVEESGPEATAETSEAQQSAGLENAGVLETVSGETENMSETQPDAQSETGTPEILPAETEPAEFLLDETLEALSEETTERDQQNMQTEQPDTPQAETEDGFVTAVEVVDSAEYTLYDAAGDELPETGTEDALSGTLQISGLASEASLPAISRYAAASFGQSYGSQLSGPDAAVYQAFETAYASQWQTGSLEVTLPQSVTFFLEYTYDEDGGKTIADRDMNASYQEAELTLIWALQAALDAFAYDHPEVFWLNSFSYYAPIQYTVSAEGYTGVIREITFTPSEAYPSAGSEIPAFRAAVDQAVNEISSGLEAGDTKAEIALAVHDYICQKAVYQENAYAHSAGGFFLHGGYVVCEGYAKAFKILCGRLGVSSILVVGDADGPHMWNYVQLENGNWYLVDATWDDQGSGIWYTYFLAGSNTMSWSGVTIGEERILYTNFSGSEYSWNFAYPNLTGASYFEDADHAHIWLAAEEKAPTCTEEGYTLYRCICNETSLERRNALGHSYRKKNYVYNNDATCLSDGTKTAVCDNGCGTKLHTVYVPGTKLAPTMEVSAKSLKLKKKQSTGKLKVTGMGPGDYVKSWITSDQRIVKVSGGADGTCTVKAGKKTGKAEITIVLASGLTKTVKVKVQENTVKTTKITGVQKKLTIRKNGKYLLTPVIKPITSGEKVTYSSSNKKVATVNAKGKIKAKKKGKTVITIRSGKEKVKCTVTVK